MHRVSFCILLLALDGRSDLPDRNIRVEVEVVHLPDPQHDIDVPVICDRACTAGPPAPRTRESMLVYIRHCRAT